MKMLFFSSDVSEIQFASHEFNSAGIPCEVRNTPTTQTERPDAGSVELWIRDDRDCHRALMLCVQLGIGFSRRPRQIDWLDVESEMAESAYAEMD